MRDDITPTVLTRPLSLSSKQNQSTIHLISFIKVGVRQRVEENYPWGYAMMDSVYRF